MKSKEEARLLLDEAVLEDLDRNRNAEFYIVDFNQDALCGCRIKHLL